MTKLFPNAMLHWEDFGVTHARRILNKYADQMCTLNDDMQGTAAVVLAAAFAAVRAASSRMREQRVVTHGAGTAGIGIADMTADVLVREGLVREEPTAVLRAGLRGPDHRRPRRGVARLPGSVRSPGQRGRQPVPRAPASRLPAWLRTRPTMLIGTSTQSAAFSEQIVKQMASKVERPIIMPLSNPTSKAEMLPGYLIRWIGDGRWSPPAARSSRSPTRAARIG